MLELSSPVNARMTAELDIGFQKTEEQFTFLCALHKALATDMTCFLN